MSDLPRYESWPPLPGGPAVPYTPPQTPAYGYGAPSWHQPVYQPTPVVTRREPSNVVPVVLAIVCTPLAVLLLVAVVSGLFVLAPLAAVVVPAGAVMLLATRPRRPGSNQHRPAPASAPARRPTRKTAPPLSHHRYTKG